MAKTFFNQTNEDQLLTLPLLDALQVIDKMKENPMCCIHLITNKLDQGQVKTTIKHHYWTEEELA